MAENRAASLKENRIHGQPPAGSIELGAPDRRWHVIIADDDHEVHRTTRLLLAGFTFEGYPLNLLSAYSGTETIELLRRHPDVAVILLDVAMESGDAGLKVVDRIRGELANPFVRIILRTADSPEKRLVSTQPSAADLPRTIGDALRTYRGMKSIDRNHRGLEKIVDASLHLFERQSLDDFVQNVLSQGAIFRLNKQIIDTQKQIIFTLGEMIARHSSETGNHVRRVADLSHLLGLRAGLSQSQADLLRLASPMHDVGKLGIPDAILFKQDILTPAEFAIIKNHTEIGLSMLKNSPRKILEAGAVVARQHHEHWDGRGYPLGLKGEEIHIFGRITTVADVFDALLHERAYKEAWSPERVLDYLRRKKGSLFDPRLVELMLENSAAFLALSAGPGEPKPS